ncbi:hypothetical protein VTO73DRAFT_1291 [Trametes versicolor]
MTSLPPLAPSSELAQLQGLHLPNHPTREVTRAKTEQRRKESVNYRKSRPIVKCAGALKRVRCRAREGVTGGPGVS